MLYQFWVFVQFTYQKPLIQNALKSVAPTSMCSAASNALTVFWRSSSSFGSASSIFNFLQIGQVVSLLQNLQTFLYFVINERPFRWHKYLMLVFIHFVPHVLNTYWEWNWGFFNRFIWFKDVFIFNWKFCTISLPFSEHTQQLQ